MRGPAAHTAHMATGRLLLTNDPPLRTDNGTVILSASMFGGKIIILLPTDISAAGPGAPIGCSGSRDEELAAISPHSSSV